MQMRCQKPISLHKGSGLPQHRLVPFESRSMKFWKGELSSSAERMERAQAKPSLGSDGGALQIEYTSIIDPPDLNIHVRR